MSLSVRRLLPALLAISACLTPGTAAAADSIFFGDWYGSAVGSVGIDGSNPNPKLIQSGEPNATAIAVSGEFVYWQTNSLPVFIGRSRLDGTEVLPKFIESTSGEVGGGGLSVDGGSIYWEGQVKGPRGNFQAVIDRANLDGTGVEYRIAALGSRATSPIVAGKYAYFIAEGSSVSPYDDIGRASLTGGALTQRFISRRRLAAGTLLAHDRSLYWLEEGGRDMYVARAGQDGSRVNTRFRKVPRRGCHRRSEITGAAIDSRYIFLACESGRIDRVTLKGPPRLRQIVTNADVEGGLVIGIAP
jgi:hypothetical protein